MFQTVFTYFDYFQTKYHIGPQSSSTHFYSLLKSYSEHVNDFKYPNPVDIILPKAHLPNFQFLLHIKLINNFSKSSHVI